MKKHSRRTGFAILALVAAGCWPFVNFINENRAAYFNLHWALVYAAAVVAFGLLLETDP